MSYDTDRYIFYHSENTALFLTECGIQICHKGHAAPLAKYPDYSAHFILEGKGFYEIEGKKYPLSAGEGFLIKPGDRCLYVADEEEPWKYIYVSFRGTQIDALLEGAKLTNKCTFTFKNDQEMQTTLYKMHEVGKADAHRGIDALGYFLVAFGRMIPKRASDEQSRTDLVHLSRAKQYIENNFSFGIHVQDVALHACIERSYLYRLFMKHEGCSPLAYLNKIRLKEAKRLLADEAYSIASVASACGFFDASHFTKAFCSACGCTPGEYRKRIFI